MDPKRAYIERTMEMVRDEWFKNHRAEDYDFMANYGAGIPNRIGNISHLRWANPESSNYLVLYFLYGSTLFVTGDLGSAIYRWSPAPDMNLIWIAKCDFQYFAEKHVGLQRGADATMWNPDVALAIGKQFFAESPRLRSFARKRCYWQTAIAIQDEWLQFLSANIQFLGDHASDAAGFGLVPDNRCIAHWLGLKMAVAQLAEAAGKTV